MRRTERLTLALLLFLGVAAAARAAVYPSTNRLSNPAFEAGSLSSWSKDGAGIAAAEDCCGQHQTFFYPSNHYDNHLCGHPNNLCGQADDTWDGYIQPEGHYVALAQGVTGLPASRSFRLSAWISTYGMPGSLRWYATSGGTRNCDGASSGFPNFKLLTCYLTTPANTSGFNVHLAGAGPSGIWVVSDDWALTQQVTPGALPGARLPTPIRYWALDYGNSVDTAAAAWNSAVGKTLFVKASSEANANLFIDGVDWGDSLDFGATWPVAGSKQRVEVNIWYFGQWESAAKVSTLSHELGHVLGLAHVNGCQMMQGGPAVRYSYCGVTAPTPADVQGAKALHP